MILQSLCEYYDTLVNEGISDVPQMCYSNAKVSYAIEITQEGELKNINSIQEPNEKGNKLFPKIITVPEQVKRSSGIAANFLCDNSKYVFGISQDKNKPVQLCEKHFEAFKKLHFNILENIEDEGANAILNFLQNWNIQNAEEVLRQVYLGDIEDLLQGANFVFNIKGEFEHIHDRELIKKVWLEYKNQSKEGETGQCLITGEETEIALLHENIKNVRGAQPAGAAIVSFNIPSFISYGKKQSYNAPVGTESAFKYTTVLNYMLQNDSKQKVQIGDATTVFWAEFPNPDYVEIAKAALDPSIKSDDKKTEAEKLQDDDTEEKLQRCFDTLRKGEKLSSTDLKIEDDAEFYILGLSPNNARVSIRFFHKCTFGRFMENLAQHHEDMELEGGRFEYIPPWIILEETTVKNSSKDKPSPLLSGRLMQSIIMGNNYPDDLYLAMIRRIKSEQDDKEKKIYSINHTRVAVIKAYLARKKKEDLPVSLDEQNTNTAYRLGRLFALLERTQENAQGDINATIKDRYFPTAMSTPGVVFPTLIKLNIHHLSKLAEKGKWFEIEMGKVLDEITAFPAHLNMEDQGLFVLGYYQQRQSFFKKREKSEELAAV